METENLGVTQLARKIKVSHPTITELVTYGGRPSFDTCVALSTWLKQSPILTLREAGLLPTEGGTQVSFEDWQHLLSQLTPDEQEEIRNSIEYKIERRLKAEQVERAKNFKPKRAG